MGFDPSRGDCCREGGIVHFVLVDVGDGELANGLVERRAFPEVPGDGAGVATVVTPQATVDYGYCWFSLSDGPAIIHTPSYDRFFSVSIFDMFHNTPGVIANPARPILVFRPGQVVPDGDFDIVEVETDQGLAFTRMVVVDNMDEVRALSASITMEGGRGSTHRDVQRFSPGVEAAALELIAAGVPYMDPDSCFGKKTGDIGDYTLAVAVMLGHLGTPAETVRYGFLSDDEHGNLFNGDDTYTLTVPAGIVRDDGYFSITIYGADNKLLIPNDAGIYDQTTYSADPNDDGTYTITLSPTGDGPNGIPTGKPFYGILRAYSPVQGADLTVAVKTAAEQ